MVEAYRLQKDPTERPSAKLILKLPKKYSPEGKQDSCAGGALHLSWSTCNCVRERPFPTVCFGRDVAGWEHRLEGITGISCCMRLALCMNVSYIQGSYLIIQVRTLMVNLWIVIAATEEHRTVELRQTRNSQCSDYSLLPRQRPPNL